MREAQQTAGMCISGTGSLKPKTGRFTAALVGAPFGVNGRVKIQSLSGETEHLLALAEAVLRRDGREQTYAIEEISFPPLTAKFAGIDTPEAAKTLRGSEILVDRSRAAPLDEGEFYIEDLKGLKVFLQSGGSRPEASPVGEIAGIVEGGGGFLVELALPAGEIKLIPFRDEFFGSIDLERRRVELLREWIIEVV